MVRLVAGGFGSAGSSRSLRHTATAVGAGTTATIVELSVRKRARQASLRDPSPAQIREAIKTQTCCWCDDPRTFRSIANHWSRAHGIKAADVRDVLVVAKQTPFASDAVREAAAERGRRRYDPEKLRTRPGGRRVLSEYGRRAAKERAKTAKRTQYGPRGLKPRYCATCGKEFRIALDLEKTKTRTTCSKPCEDILRSRRLTGIPRPYARPPHKPRQSHPCATCGKEFIGRVARTKTCSEECRRANKSAKARARTGWMDHIREVHLERLRARVIPTCADPDGCPRPAHCKGLCTMHYQRLKKARRADED